MARSTFSNAAKLISTFASASFGRRLYAAATSTNGAALIISSANTATGSSGAGALLKVKSSDQAAAAVSRNKASWGPDPKTGYYRPEGGVAAVDGAELRAEHVKIYHH